MYEVARQQARRGRPDTTTTKKADMAIDTTAGKQVATAPGSGETTVLDTSKAAAPDLAWSLDGDDDEQAPAERYSWGLVWRNAALLVVVAAALAAVLVSVMRDRHESAQSSTVGNPTVARPATAVTSPPTPTPKAAPPTTVTVTASPSKTVDAAPSQTVAPPAPPRAPSQADLDERFMGDLTASGMQITSVSAVIASGHEICAYLAAGHTPVDTAAEVLRNNAGLTPATAEVMVDSAAAVYCPHYSG
jgi:hypothetical protein